MNPADRLSRRLDLIIGEGWVNILALILERALRLEGEEPI
jgi:hypothetical protein